MRGRKFAVRTNWLLVASRYLCGGVRWGNVLMTGTTRISHVVTHTTTGGLTAIRWSHSKGVGGPSGGVGVHTTSNFTSQVAWQKKCSFLIFVYLL
jgi:hypothetical protein